MNCKAGDLAVIVSGSAFRKHFGRIVTVTKLYKSDIFLLWHLSESLDGNPDGWLLVPDKCLRPIRDTPGEDESLQWAPVPGERVTA